MTGDRPRNNAVSDYLSDIEKHLTGIYNGLSGGREEIKTAYIEKADNDNLEAALKFSREEDGFTKSTSVGPHRDDIDITINGIAARVFGSQGQKRSVALALKFAGAEVLKQKTGEYPVCLLDDVMSELDEGRQNYVLNRISGWQSFITCCDPGSARRLKEGKIIEISDGRVK